MNAFQIWNKENISIPINKLDEEICELLEIPVDKKHYCMLGKREEYKSDFDYFSHCPNWFDVLGWLISEGKTFEDIIEYYKEVFKDFIGEKDETGQVLTLEIIIPYKMKVLKYWIEQGYQPKQIKQ